MRPHRIQQNEYPYHITTRTNGRRFRLKPSTYRVFIGVLLEVTKRFNVHIQHIKLMDDHYHLKLFTPDSNISEIMQFFNDRTAKRINKNQRTCGHLWGQRFHSCIVDGDEYEENCVVYIYQNGPRAGLCRKASEDPRLSSFEFYANGKKIPFTVVADDFYLLLGRTDEERQRRFRETVDQPLDPVKKEKVQKELRHIFYGSADFKERMRQRFASHFA